MKSEAATDTDAVKPAKMQEIAFPVMQVQQGKNVFYLFSAPASMLFRLLQINRRLEDKREGYQRALSASRVRSIQRYIEAGRVVPGVIIAALDEGIYDAARKVLTLPRDKNIGWVVDGQHRLAGAFQASEGGTDVLLPVAGFLGSTPQDQIELFITINREARGVPASLYIDLLQELPRSKSERELNEERIADIARRLNIDELSPFYQRIIFTRTARVGELSLVNFARILRPLIDRTSGTLSVYTQPEQEGVITNYYKAIGTAFPKAWEKDVFFRTIGFGGVWRAFPLIFTLALTRHNAFTVSAIARIFAQISDFDFESWTQLGTGSGAEIQAGNDLIQRIQDAFSADNAPSVTLKLEDNA